MSRAWIVGMVGVVGAACVAGCIALSPTRLLPDPVGTAFRDVDDDKYTPQIVTLYSLAPETLQPPGEGTETFHGFPVRGKTEVKDAATRRKLFNAFARGVQDHDGSVAACFIPHHGLRIQHGKRTTDLVICFMCAQVHVYENGNQAEAILISKSPKPAFDDVLRAAKIAVD